MRKKEIPITSKCTTNSTTFQISSKFTLLCSSATFLTKTESTSVRLIFNPVKAPFSDITALEGRSIWATTGVTKSVLFLYIIRCGLWQLIFSLLCEKNWCGVIFYRKRLNKIEISFFVSTTTPSWDRRHDGPNVDVAWPQPDFLFGFPECRLNDRLSAVTSATREANLTSMWPENKKIQLL